MTSILSFPTFPDLLLQKDDQEQLWLDFNSVTKLLKDRLLPCDKNLKPCNLWREAQVLKYGSRVFEGNKDVSVSSFFRFIYNHIDDFAVCRQISKELEKCVMKKLTVETSCATSIHECYLAVRKETIKLPVFESVLSKVSFDGIRIPTLQEEYSIHFSQDDWKRICLFEYHFGQEYDITDMTHDKAVRCRWEYLLHLRNTKQSSQKMNEVYRRLTQMQMKRKLAAEERNGIHIIDHCVHKPGVIELDTFSSIEDVAPEILRLAVVDCLLYCAHQKGLHVVAETTTTDIDELQNISYLIQKALHDQHNSHCSEIVYCESGAFNDFVTFDGSIQRFLLRDAILMKQMADLVIYIWKPETCLSDHAESTSSSTPPMCPKCFNNESSISPLEWQTLNITQEWHIHVPLATQMMMESFINSQSVFKSSDQLAFIEGKLAKLYTIFDSLLNIRNRCYSGVIQDLNTKELSMNSHSIRTVFSVANTSGATLSFNSAERNLKSRAREDILYYNTYIKQYPLKYNSISGSGTFHVNLRQCHPVFYVDNLARLSHHADPMRGQTSTSQIPMLPITVKGLPENSKEIEGWHNMLICDGSKDCHCKDPVVLKKDDINDTLLDKTEAERDVFKRFDQLCRWGLKKKWGEIYKG